ncbi:hypothetical protein [uncultured Flavobacterium sp.]|uniref:hypothetical protein n=1 Tax=uncultured Flavobacterium sp. TaxID=165435 RepID=UPI0025E01A61|nr:hypothetical protein [uncultured Flavobacterium sp.]
MKFSKIITLCSFGFIAACSNKRETENAAIIPDFSIDAKEADWDRNEIDKLVKGTYKWLDTVKTPGAFRPFVKDSMIVGYDRIAQNLHMVQLDKSGYFATEFIDNIARIFNEQDELLRSGKAKWLEGDMPPFGYPDVNAWCGCQDSPTDDYDTMNVVIEKMTSGTAELYWNWTGFGKDWENEHYHIKTVKVNGKWKIAWMEGWDYEKNVKI